MKIQHYANLVFPSFARAVLELNSPMTYGFFANQTDLNSATDSKVLGQVMHLIGACCMLIKIPIAPLYFVRREDNKETNIFLSNDLERIQVAPHEPMLRVLAREHSYTVTEIEKLKSVLQKAEHNRPFSEKSPHEFLEFAIKQKKEGSHITLWQEALIVYQEEYAALQKRG